MIQLKTPCYKTTTTEHELHKTNIKNVIKSFKCMRCLHPTEQTIGSS